MKRTIYDTRRYILKDLKGKDERIRFIMNYFSGLIHRVEKDQLLDIDQKYCDFYNYLEKCIEVEEEKQIKEAEKRMKQNV